MALGSTQSLTEMSTRNLPGGGGGGGLGRPVRKGNNLITFSEPIVWKMWEARRLTTLWVSTACYRDSLTFKLSGISENISPSYSGSKSDQSKKPARSIRQAENIFW
jgi:hypothetical protein